jgi:hypothetical protein
MASASKHAGSSRHGTVQPSSYKYIFFNRLDGKEGFWGTIDGLCGALWQLKRAIASAQFADSVRSARKSKIKSQPFREFPQLTKTASHKRIMK